MFISEMTLAKQSFFRNAGATIAYQKNYMTCIAELTKDEIRAIRVGQVWGGNWSAYLTSTPLLFLG